MHYIFRKTDREFLYAASTPEQFDNELTACLRNEGGSLSDYVIVNNADKSIPAGMTPELQADDTVKYILSPGRVKRAEVRASIAVKLQAAGLDLTDGELSVLTKGA